MDASRLSTSDDTDPWGSPSTAFKAKPASVTHQSESLANGGAPVRTTSAFSTSATNQSSGVQSQPPTLSGSSGDGTGWGGTDFGPPSAGVFGGSDIAPGEAFSGTTGVSQTSPSHPVRISARRRVSHGTQEVLSVTALEQKEGTFLFQYRNYEISSNRRSTTVVRRYSDFVWLLDCLHKRYPFRQLPLLPPKRVSSMSLLNNPQILVRLTVPAQSTAII